MFALVAAVAVQIDAQALREHVEFLADDRLEGRAAGEAGGEKAAAYVAGKLEAFRLKPIGTDGYYQPFEFRRGMATAKSKNVVAAVEGTDLKGEWIVVGAHYDGLGKRGQENSGQATNPAGDPKDGIWNGADDNASGVAAALEIAFAMARAKDRPRRSVAFVFFSAGEWMLQGSKYFAEHPPGAVVAMINLEMIGRNPERPVDFGGVSSSPDWKGLIESAAEGSKLPFELSPVVSEAGDQYSFRDKRVPALHVFTDFHEDYHAQTDHADKLAYDRMAAIAGVVRKLVEALANRDARPAWSEPVEWHAAVRKLGMNGIEVEPDQAAGLGLSPNEGGLRAEGVEAGGAAARAGVRVGDVLVSIDGRPFPSGKTAKVILHMIVRHAKPGADIPFVVLRDKRRVTLSLRWPD